MTWPTPNRKDHLAFCQNEGWTQVRRATGTKGSRHLTFELDLPDGRILRTRISHPATKKSTYGVSLWKHILRDQLDIDESSFWACVQSKITPQRGVPPPPRRGIPIDLYRLLTGQAGMPDRKVRSMTREEAIAAAQEFWTSWCSPKPK